MDDPEIVWEPRELADTISKPLLLIPVTAEDVQRQHRRRIVQWLVIALIATVAGGITYKRVTDPQNAREAFDAGMRLMQATRYDQAILNFSRAVDLEPEFVEAYRMRGRAYVAGSHPEQAIRDFSRVAQMRPGDSPVMAERGFARLDEKDYASATADADRAIALDPKLARAFNLRGTARRAAGDVSKALEDFTRAVDLDPNLDNYFQRASTYQMMGEHRLAIADFGRALREDPQQPHTYYARAESRAALGDSAGARADIGAGRKIDGW